MSLLVQFVYDARLAGGSGYASEQNPVLDVYLTHHVGGESVFFFNSNQIAAQGVDSSGKFKTTLSVRFKLSPFQAQQIIQCENLLPIKTEAVQANQLPKSCAIVFNAYVETRNEQMLWARTRAGGAFIPLEGMNMTDWNAVVQNNDDKGEVAKGRVRLTEVQWIGFQPSFIPVGPDVDLRDTIRRSLSFYFGKDAEYSKPTFGYLMRVHCPEYRTRFGSLPGSTYALQMPCETIDQTIFEKVLAMAVRRSGFSAEELHDIAVTQLNQTDATYNPRFVAVTTVLARMLSIIPNAMAYLDDFVNDGGDSMRQTGTGSGKSWQRVGALGHMIITEDFRIARRGWADDCEGVADESRIEFGDLSEERLRIDTSRSIYAKLLRQIQRLCTHYVDCMILADVTNKKLDANGIPDADALAHTFFCLIPKLYFAKQMRTSKSVDGAMLAQLRGELQAQTRAWQTNLHVLVCEGTAPIDPMIQTLDRYDNDPLDMAMTETRILARRRAAASVFGTQSMNLSGLQTEMFQDRVQKSGAIEDYSKFYKSLVSFATPQFKHHGILDFAFVHSQSSTYGVRFDDLIDMEPHVTIVASLRLTPAERTAIVDMMMLLEPIPQLRVPKDASPPLAMYERLMRIAQTHPARPEVTNWGMKGVPLMPLKIVLTYREMDTTAKQITGLCDYLEAELKAGHIDAVRVTREAIAAAPLEQETMPELVVLDVEMFLTGKS